MRNKRDNDIIVNERITVDTLELSKLLSCGTATATKIGMEAGARIKIGKRVLWNAEKIKIYLDSITTV